MWKKGLVIVLAPYSVWLAFAYRYHFIDNANLLFHEGGHIFLGFFGQTLHFLGGTIGQLFFPAACAWQFWRQEKPFEAWVCLFWFGESMMYMAEYMGDARDRVLPLVGGGIHDWHWLFSQWGVLDHCRGIAGFFHALASVLVWVCVAMMIRLAWLPKTIKI